MPTVPSQSDVHFDPAIQTEEIAYKPSEMVECSSCDRRNPPNRLRCLYCAGELQLTDTTAVKLTFRILDPWEKGWNVVIVTPSEPVSDLRKAAAMLSIDGSDLERMSASGVGVPAVRVESEAEAKVIRTSLAGLGIRAAIMSDKALEGDRPPIRLSGIENMGSVRAIDFNTREGRPLDPDDIALIVTGTIETSQIDMVEKRRRGKTKLLNETATISDEALIDIYSRTDHTGYRIQMSGFDFSCLGNDKAMLAYENIRRLIEFLEVQFPKARVVNAYDGMRDLITRTWPPAVRKDHKGLVFAGFGKREFGKSESVNNLDQFTKFSRLQWHLL